MAAKTRTRALTAFEQVTFDAMCDGTYWDTVKAVPCKRPRCSARQAGEHCTTPNGRVTAYHRERVETAYADKLPAKTTKPRTHRLTDAQAQRIENAAQYGEIYATGQQSMFRGDAADRACADALVDAGLMTVTRTDVYGGRYLTLTVEGWRTFHTNRLIIDRTDHTQHAPICPCRTGEGTTTTERPTA